MSEVKKLATASVLSALSFIMILLAQILPIPYFWIMVSGVVIHIILQEVGVKYGGLAYLVVSLLGLILLPHPRSIMAFVTFYGCYPILKKFLDKVPSKAMRFGGKFLAIAILKGIGTLVNFFIFGLPILNFMEDSPFALIFLVGIAVNTLMGFNYDWWVGLMGKLLMDKIQKGKLSPRS
ncbi:MAG: hypothetical protein FWF59_08385 [Turicibacter sp.]|nr:hypothetical protein [Turicibacter sp.]